MKAEHEIEPVEIYAGDILQAEMLKSMLENAGIRAFLKDEFMGTLSAPGGAGAVKVLISNEDAERARLIVDEFEEKNSTYE